MKTFTPKITKEEFEILKPICQCPCNEEILWKDHYETKGVPNYKHGHNLKCLSEESILKKGDSISKSKTGVKRLEFSGEKHPNYGKHPIAWNKDKTLSETHCKHLSESHIGIKQRLETIEKISATMKGIVRTEEHQNNLNTSLRNTYKNGRKLVIGSKCPYISKYNTVVTFRSTWELEFAKYLDNINELWYYEFWTFDLGNTTYTPDFYLPRKELFVEIKGWWYNEQSKIKYERFLKEYCFENIILIQQPPPYNNTILQ